MPFHNRHQKYFLRLFLCLAALFFFTKGVHSQQIDSVLGIYSEKYDQERCHLHYDKSSYAPGETIWFKAYLMNAVLPANESKNFYVDWTDEKGNLLLHSVYPIVDAVSNGQFPVPVDYKGSYLRVKAYTKWMLNFDSAFLYQRDIPVQQLKDRAAKTVPAVKASLQFFPEGGELVAGVKNKIAFKSNDQWGHPVQVKGVVQNNRGIIFDSLRTIHDGMGYFFIVPGAGETYYARWKDEKGKIDTTALPVVREHGAALQVSMVGNKKQVLIQVSPGAGLDSIYITGTMNQQLVFKVSREILSGQAKIIVPVLDLPSGIMVITVFNKQWVPLAERISFINNLEYVFRPEMNVQHWGLSKRARNEIIIEIPDSLVANLSVAVTDAGINTDSSRTIISELLLSSEIKGRLHNPAYYFSSNDEMLSQHLDLVMLTHGWRRIRWEELVQGKLPALRYPRDTAYLHLTGQVYGATPNQLKEAAGIFLLIKPKKGEGQTLLTPIRPNGYFEEPIVLFDSVRIYYQLMKKKGIDDVSVSFMGNRLPPPRYNAAASGLFSTIRPDTSGSWRHYLLAEESRRLIDLYEGKVLGNVTVTAKTKSQLDVMDEKYASGLFRGDGMQFDLVNDRLGASYFNIFNYLQGKVAGLQVSNAMGGTPSLQWRGGSPQLFVDEVPAQPDMVASIPVTDVAYIKVFRPPFFGGFNGANGAIAIYTRRGDDMAAVPGKGLSYNVVTGYSEIREFYSPNYATFKKENEKKDVRTTIYWNPQVRLAPAKKKAVLVFYNNDVSKAFRVVIEGMTSDGKMARLEQLME
jgi:hypothetical protein